jgi:hypothetical protein
MSKENNKKKTGGFQQSSSNPELGWVVGCPAGEYSHAFVGEGVEEVDACHKEVKNTKFQKYPVLYEIAGGE